MRINLLTFLLFFISSFSFSQKKDDFAPKKNYTPITKPISADCSKPILINVSNGSFYGATIPPKGFGEIQEFTTNNSLTFEGEHNSAWYLLTVTRDGELVFDIVPQDTTNDYDFLLYSYTDSTFCDVLQKNKLKPIRNNLSNIKKSVKGVTGLSTKTNKNSIGEGTGIAYSTSIDVKKGEKYVLVLDNVTPEGKGHTLFFYFMKDVEIKGKVIGADSVPLIANITLSDNKGNTVEETSSNAKGEYKINTQLKENQNYNITYLSEETFVQSTTINTKDLKGGTVFPDIKTILPKLKKGEKYKLGNINFYPETANLLPESLPSIQSLYKLMQKNKKMIISIQGHVNSPGRTKTKGEEIFEQKLSEDRANSVYSFLLKKGIEKTRMTTEGFSCKQMLFPKPKNGYEEQANRRVEIKVISIE